MNLKNFKQFIRNPLLALLFGISMIISVINFLGLFFFIGKLNTSIILHYNVYLGVDSVGDGNQVFLMPAVGFSFAIVNLFLAYYFFSQKERMVSHVLSLTTFISQLGLTVASTSIIIVNYF
jgi:hypothetical protein